ncbi:MAG: polysaccharide deacetylase family protein [Armatimonadota bacterium]|nr:polysaccharide deacetylase family protein [Armatimonadota bacterium]
MTQDPSLGRVVAIELALAQPVLDQSSVRAGSERRPRIALTFDDGPSADYTPQILDILAEHGGRATFFVLGALVSSHKQLLQRMEDEGHEIGIHTWWHAKLTALSDGAIAADLARCQSALDGVLQRPVRWVRPPYGEVDDRVRSAIAAAGYRVAMWSVDPRDWQRPGSTAVANRILNCARDGAVVVLHDGGGNRAGTVKAMHTVVPALRERGFEMVTLSELMGLAEPPPRERGMVLSIGGEQFEVDADFEDVTVEVDGREVELETPPVMCAGQFLVQGRPVLRALGAGVWWRPEDLVVGILAPRGRFEVRLNSLQVTRDGREIRVRVPSVYYHDHALLPVWLMANACRARVQFDQQTRTIEFFTDQAARLGLAPRRCGGMSALSGVDGIGALCMTTGPEPWGAEPSALI